MSARSKVAANEDKFPVKLRGQQVRVRVRARTRVGGGTGVGNAEISIHIRRIIKK